MSRTAWNKGVPMSLEQKEKLRVAKLGRTGQLANNWRGGMPNCKCGKTLSSRKSIQCVGCRMASTNHPRYITDRSLLSKKQERGDSAYREWRKSVRDRDGWVCKISNGDCLGKVVAHHILPWSIFLELRYDVNNGITLCRFHHPRKRMDEVKLSPYFQSMVLGNRN